MDSPASAPRTLALWAAGQKLAHIAEVSDSRTQDTPVLAAVAEACWWLASLDEDLDNEHKFDYRKAREADPRGVLLKGVRWARHRHTHDLITTSHGDVRPFLSDEPGVMFYISKPYSWRSVESMNLQGESATRNPKERERYIEKLEGEEVLPTLQKAHEWLTEAVQKFPATE